MDVFLRPSGTFGFEEFRRDPEDMGTWTPLHYYCDKEFTDLEATLRAAMRTVSWYALLGGA